MNEFMAGVVRAAVETFDFPEPILEVGSFQVAGQQEIAELRRFFPGRKYVGIDMRQGPGVDSVENVEQLPRADRSVGSVLALNTFEHVEHFWRGFDEIQRVLRLDGLLLVSCPFHLHIHAYPNDYWRFTPEAFRSLLQRMPTKIVGYHGTRNNPLDVWALAAGPGYPTITAEQHSAFEQRVRQYAHEPMEWHRWIRYQFGKWICGRRPFAAILEAEHFETTLYRAA
jgi:SAM-dependent methyltransferase